MRDLGKAWRLRICAKCGAMVALRREQPPMICADCGGHIWSVPALAPWKLTPSDQRLLRSFRIGR